MPTLVEFDSLQENIDLMRELRLDLIEINMNLPDFQLSDLKNLNIEDDIIYSLHLPEDLNIWDFNNKIKNAYLDTVSETVQIAKIKKINIINMHMNAGVYFTLPEKKVYLFEKEPEKYLEYTEDFMNIISELLKDTDIKIYIENTGIYNLDFIKKAVVKLLESDRFSLTWDVGHDYSSGNKDSGLLEKMNSRIQHLHLHDAVDQSNHLPLGMGNIDFEKVFRIAVNSVNTIIFETKTAEGLKKSVDYFRNNLEQMFRVL